jgi:hypothetical protein
MAYNLHIYFYNNKLLFYNLTKIPACHKQEFRLGYKIDCYIIYFGSYCISNESNLNNTVYCYKIKIVVISKISTTSNK